MEQILQTIIENLVDNKEEISIGKAEENGKEIYRIKVASNEMGKVIGKQGAIAKSIRTVARAIGSKEQKKVEVEFVD